MNKGKLICGKCNVEMKRHKLKLRRNPDWKSNRFTCEKCGLIAYLDTITNEDIR